MLVAGGEDPSASLARAREAVVKAAESDHGSPALHLWQGQLASIEARGLAKATSPADVARRKVAVETAKKELAAAVAGNKFYDRQATELLAGL